MKAIVLTEGESYELLEVPTPEAAEGEIRIKVASAGICGTDLHIMSGEFPAGRGRPLILGHEFAGVVDQVGPGVTGFEPGDRVAADPNLYCRSCPRCSEGAYNMCEHWGALGITTDGALAEYVCVPAFLAVHLPDDLSMRTGAMIEPLSCAMHAFDYAGLTGRSGTGSRALIYGAGMMGLACLSLAAAQRLEVDVVEIHSPRREFARNLGAHTAVGSGEELTHNEYDLVIDATGSPAAITDAITRLAPRGTYLQVGVPPPEFTVDISPYDIYQRELLLIGTFSVADQYVAAARAIADLPSALEGIVTHTFPLERFGDALEAMKTPEAIKVHIDIS